MGDRRLVQKTVRKPQRMCLCCRRKTNKEELYRLVWIGSKLILDVDQKSVGRGAYVHKVWTCVSKLSEARRLERVFKLAVGEVTPEGIKEALSQIREEVLKGEDPDGSNKSGTKRNRIRI